jgi:glycosyltransferase involved in cell wall biosynthesis
MLEAMRAGLPILASDSGGNSEALGAGKAGQIFPAGNTAAAASALALLASDTARRLALAKASLGYFGENYSLEAFRRKAADIYESVLKSSGAVGAEPE